MRTRVLRKSLRRYRSKLNKVLAAANFIRKTSIKVPNFDSVKSVRELREAR